MAESDQLTDESVATQWSEMIDTTFSVYDKGDRTIPSQHFGVVTRSLGQNPTEAGLPET